MTRKNKIEFHIPLILALTMFAAITIPLLSLPYCYSETQLLSDSIFYMKNHGIGAVFNDNSVELPDLFSVLMMLIAKLFSTSPLCLHITAMIFSLLSIAVAYNFGKFFFSVQAGVMSAAIMCIQNVFVAQSGLVLPEMLLNLCILSALYSFFREKYDWCSVFASIATLIDITGFITAIFVLTAYFRIKYREWYVSKNIILSIPIALWFLYQILSLSICGKFSIRYHETSVSNFVDNLYFIFVAQYRFVLTAVLVLLVTINTINKQMLYFVKNMAVSATILFVLIFLTNSLVGSEQTKNLTLISMFSIFVGCLISTLHVSYYSKYTIACTIIVANALGTMDRNEISDAYVNYKSKVKVDMKTTEIITNNADPSSTIFCDKYMSKYLSDSNYGYVDKNVSFRTDTTINQSLIRCKWAILSQFQQSEIANMISENEIYEKRNTIFIGNCKNEIYQQKKIKY